MAEYIERENLFKFLTEQMTRKQNGAFAKGFNKGIMVARAAVHNKEITPSADVVEVVHGKWVHIKDYGGGKCLGHCSVCWAPQEADNPSVIKEVFRYCRWCGAKMDGDVDEGKIET